MTAISPGLLYASGVEPDQSPEERADTLHAWWMDHAAAESAATVSKMVEYGSADLASLARDVFRMTGSSRRLDDWAEATQIGCLIYLLGKVQRMVEAVAEGRPIHRDHPFDVAVYAKMMQAVQDGAWVVHERNR